MLCFVRNKPYWGISYCVGFAGLIQLLLLSTEEVAPWVLCPLWDSSFMGLGWTYRGALEKMLKNRASPSSGSTESAAYKLFNLKKTLNGVIFQGISISDGRVQRRRSQALLRDAQWQWAQSKTLQSKNLPSEYQETFFCCHGDWAVTNLALGAHGISFLRETQ